MESLVVTWYDWLVFVGVFATAAIAIYLFFETQDLSDPSGANIVRIISIVGFVMTLPSLWLKIDVLNDLPDEFLGIEFEDLLLNNEIFLETYPNLMLFGNLGLLGVVVSVVGIIYYFTSVRKPESYVPTMMPTQLAVPPPLPPDPAPEPSRQKPAPAPTQPLHPNLPANAWLVMRAGSRAGTQYGLDERGANIIGRDPSRADIVIDEDTVSREHARIRHDNGQYVLYDLASTSGTFVNNRRVQKQLLYDDDIVQVGRVEFVFKKVS